MPNQNNPYEPAPVTPGPFSSFLQAPVYPQLNQLMNQSDPQPTGWTTPAGTVGHYIQKFMEGASTARARALQEQQQKEVQDAGHFNQSLQTMLSLAQDRDPEEAQPLVNEFLTHRAGYAAQDMSKSKHPILSGIGKFMEQALMGGGPVDEQQGKDSAGHTITKKYNPYDNSMGDSYVARMQQLTPMDKKYTQAIQGTPSKNGHDGGLYQPGDPGLYQRITDSINALPPDQRTQGAWQRANPQLAAEDVALAVKHGRTPIAQSMQFAAPSSIFNQYRDKAIIEESGDTPVENGGFTGQGSSQPSGSPISTFMNQNGQAQPPAAATPKVNPGDLIKLQDGRQVRVKSVLPNGSYDVE